ncbi:kinase-like protein [Macrolepiota fuliginosa MF-IS2]|uniref:Kinase-like protein n=1 Tax=Macrolepiota fuliginosa MF-IS2 TaxID=1400762 RepID=A0A9P5X9N7_9AGAR|nr:kinase-like protein [Macrolepiota fuliginosa MF-IS2]
MLSQTSWSFQQVLVDIRSHLGSTTSSYARFLSLVEELLATYDSRRVDGIVLDIAQLLRTSPAALYQLNPLFYPRARVEFNLQYAPVTSFVLTIQDSSRIVLLDSHDERLFTIHNLSALQLREIILHPATEDHTYDDLCSVKDPAIRDCLAQLTQNLLDRRDLSKAQRKEILNFLQCLGGTPPSLLLYEIMELDLFAQSIISDLYNGCITDIHVVIKKPRIPKDSLDNSEILRELILCRQLHHPSIIPFLGVIFDERDQLGALVIPHMRHGNVIDFLKSHPTINRSTPIWQIMRGLEFLHTFQPPIAHRSIKGTNILVNDGLICCLADFGLSLIPDIAQRTRDYAVATMPWMAPEAFVPPEDGQLDLFKLDVFALGITVLEIFLGKPPLSDQSFPAMYAARVIQKETPSFPESCPFPVPPYLPELVEMMLDYEPSRRPPIRLICQGFEDNIHFPREIPPVDEVIHQAQGTEDPPALRIAQEWIKKERGRTRRSRARTKGTSTKSASSSRSRTQRVAVGPSHVKNMIAQSFHWSSSPDDYAGHPALLTHLPFYRAVMSPAPPDQFISPYITTLAQRSTPLTPPDSPPAATITVHPRPIPLAHYTPPILQYGRDSTYFTVTQDDQESFNMATPSQSGTHDHPEGSLSPPPSPGMTKRSSGSVGLGEERRVHTPILQSYEGDATLYKRRLPHAHSTSSSPPGSCGPVDFGASMY